MREVFMLALPLVVSQGTHATKLFFDRLMLAWYSEHAIAAALSAGMTAFMVMSFFMGIVGYANSFVAQYYGARHPGRIGLSVWQSILLALGTGLIIVLIGRMTYRLFSAIGHPGDLYRAEESYYLVILSGAPFTLVSIALSCFWTGRNRPWTVVIVNIVSVFLNGALNWLLIFGARGSPHLSHAPFPLNHIGRGLNDLAQSLDLPRWGAYGAGIATIATEAVSMTIFVLLFVRRPNRIGFGTWPAKAFNFSLMRRMVYYGFGNGMQFFLDISAFALFNILMGKYAVIPGAGNVAAASSIALSVNGIAFIPMIGIGMAASILVGQAVGSKNIPHAKAAVRSARIIIVAYMATMAGLFVFVPEAFISLFGPDGSLSMETANIARNFLLFAAAWAVCDGFFILYSSAIRGAGDTKFAMYVMGGMGWGLFAVPCLLAYYFGASYYVLWAILAFYAFLAGIVFYLRYRQGKWEHMRVIEDAVDLSDLLSPTQLPARAESGRLTSRRKRRS